MIDPYAWTPFGGGMRRCLGMHFALFEMKTVLTTVIVAGAPARTNDHTRVPFRAASF